MRPALLVITLLLTTPALADPGPVPSLDLPDSIRVIVDPGVSTLDTLRTTAPRVTVAEVVRRIGARMASERARIRTHEYTGLTKIIAIHGTDADGIPERKIYETAERVRLDRGGDYQHVTLWRREQTWKHGELAKTEVKDEVETSWETIGEEVRESIPFSPESGDDYTYAIVDRALADSTVIYEVRYTPKSKFDGLSSGTVWIDYGEYVIRRLAGEIVESPPVPLLVRAISDFRARFKPCGDFWVLDDIYARIELRDVPLLGLPRTLEFHYWTQGHVINGVRYEPEPALPDTALPDTASPDTTTGYWDHLDAHWDDAIGDDLFGFPLSDARVDSLTDMGRDRIAAMLAGRVFKVNLDPIGRLDFDRVEGLRPGASLKVRHLSAVPPTLELGAGYGLSSHRWIADGSLRVPLVRRQPRRPDGQPTGLAYPRLEAEIFGADSIRRFGGDPRPERTLQAIFAGDDPNQYLGTRSAGLTLRLRPARRLTLSLGGHFDNERPLPVATRWTVFGNTEDVADNEPAERLVDHAITAGVGLEGRRWTVALDAARHHALHTDFHTLALDTRGSALDRHGNELALHLAGRIWDRRAPVQWKTWLGDWPTLRGYDIQELAGDHATWGNVDVRWGTDVLKALRVPLLGKLGLQPLSFVDAAWSELRDPQRDARWRDGFRMDAGVGFGKLIGGAGIGGRLRVYAAHPVFDGQEGQGWRFLLVFEP